MSGIFSTLNTANKGLNAQQIALNTASHNISNANTEGFSRQRVDLKADLAYTYGGIGQLGTGVKVNGVIRMVDDYVTRQIREEGSSLNQYMTKSETLEQMEIIYNEPSDTGLNFNIGEMFESWQGLAKNPESLTSKTIVVEKSKTFADTLNHISDQLESLVDETGLQIEKQITDIKAVAQNIDTLNQQIFNVSIKGLVPNDLLDQRDVLMKDLSSMTDFTSSFDKYGRVEISVGTSTLIGIEVDNTSNINNFDGATSTSGALQGYKDAQTLINIQIAEIKDFAEKIASEFNGAHKPADSTETSYDFFNIDADGKISVNQDLVDDNSLVLAGENYGSAPGDSSTAVKIAAIRDKSDIGFSAGKNTIEGAFNTMVTKVGISKQHSDNMVTNQEVLVNQLQIRRESTSGVSLDEEFTNVIQFQKAFEANARVISVLTDMLDVLINGMGV